MSKGIWFYRTEEERELMEKISHEQVEIDNKIESLEKLMKKIQSFEKQGKKFKKYVTIKTDCSSIISEINDLNQQKTSKEAEWRKFIMDLKEKCAQRKQKDFIPISKRKRINPAGENAYYSCQDCGIELVGEEVGIVAAGPTYANGEHAHCPECGEINSIFRDDENV